MVITYFPKFVINLFDKSINVNISPSGTISIKLSIVFSELDVWFNLIKLAVIIFFIEIHFWFISFHSYRKSNGNGFKSIPATFPPCFNNNMSESIWFIAILILDSSLLLASLPSNKYSDVWTSRLNVRNRFIAAIFIEFPK